MQTVPSHSDALSHDPADARTHRSAVHASEATGDSFRKTPHAAAPAARNGTRFYNALSASSVGLEFGVSVIITLLVGIWLDGKLGTEPWLMLGCMMLGFVAGFRAVLHAVARSDRAAARDQAGRGPHRG